MWSTARFRLMTERNGSRSGLETWSYTPSADVAAITTFESDYGTEIQLGDDTLALVSDDDAEHMHASRALLAKYYAGEIRKAVAQARHEHSAKFLIRAAIYALATLLLYVLIVWLVVVGSRWLLKRLQRPGAPLVKGIKIQKSEILAGERLASILAGFVRLLRAVILFLLTVVFLGAEFKYFPWTRVHGKQLLEYVLTPVRFVGIAVLNYLPKLFYIVVILAVMYFVMKFVRILAREFERGNIRIKGFYPEWIQPTYKIVRFLLICFTAVLIYPYMPGENSPAFKGVGLFLGVLFSLGSTSAVANVGRRHHSDLHPGFPCRRLGKDRRQRREHRLAKHAGHSFGDIPEGGSCHSELGGAGQPCHQL